MSDQNFQSPRTNSPPGDNSTRPLLVLAIGAVLGLVLVGFNLFGDASPDAEGVPHEAAAEVNGVIIQAAEFGAALERYAGSRGGVPDAADSNLVLDALIEEELLVQRARELGIDRNDRLVRDLMAKTVVEVVAIEAESKAPAAADVAAFYAGHAELFAPEPMVWIREIRFGTNNFRTNEQAADLAQKAVARLREGDEFDRVQRETGDRPEVPLPDRPLSEMELRRSLGSAAARHALTMEPGEVSDPVRGASGYHVLKLVAREVQPAPPLGEIEDQVRSEMRRRAHEGAIREYVAELRAHADIRLP